MVDANVESPVTNIDYRMSGTTRVKSLHLSILSRHCTIGPGLALGLLFFDINNDKATIERTLNPRVDVGSVYNTTTVTATRGNAGHVPLKEEK